MEGRGGATDDCRSAEARRLGSARRPEGEWGDFGWRVQAVQVQSVEFGEFRFLIATVSTAVENG